MERTGSINQILGVGVLLGMLCPSVGFAADAPVPATSKISAGDRKFFESKIRPVLIEHCYKCHSIEAKKSKGDLLLDSRNAIRKGGESGPAVVPGDAAKSKLLAAISHSDPELKMPPKKPRLPDAVIADFKSWILRGAPDPRESIGLVLEKPPVDIESGRKFWAFIKPARHKPPRPKPSSKPGWAKRDLDHFILSKLDAAGLAPRPDADPIALLRRVHDDLIGLPPTPKDVAHFVSAIDSVGLDTALTVKVDKLLASARYGERWGRHWLDVARFGESSGKETNITFPHAWRYRDYVIDAFNADISYKRFLIEQIAGDLLPADSNAEKARLMIATGFLAVGPKSLNEMNVFQSLADIADEQIDAVSRSVMAATVACARCHDHKFDPFLMTDYYALAGIFVSTNTYYGTSVAPGNIRGGDLLILPKVEGQLIPNKSMPAMRVANMKKRIAALDKEMTDGKAAALKAALEGKDASKVFGLRDVLRIIWIKGGLKGKLKTVNDKGEALPLCMGVADRPKIYDVPLLDRGEISRPGKKIPRGFPKVIQLPDVKAPAPLQGDSQDVVQSGRLELARWLTHDDHPLTARVIVNRVWHYLLGAGIVRTVDNFGFKGDRPTHPELLDHLALKFIDQRWSIKRLIRRIVLSRTYRQASSFDRAAFEKDPQNKLLWRTNKRRLDAESIRDHMLFVAGQLDVSRRPGSLIADIGERPVGIFAFIKQAPADLDGSKHRSVYLPIIRDRLPDVLDLFDFAEPSMVTGARQTTNVPLQALYFMNSSFVQEQSAALAKRIMAETKDHNQRIDLAFMLCFSRLPNAGERELAKRFFTNFYRKSSRSPSDRVQAYGAFCQGLLSTAEFRYLD